MNPDSPDTPRESGGSDLNPYDTDTDTGEQAGPPVSGPPPAAGPPPGWAPGYPAYQMRRPTNGMAIGALIAGIVALFSCPLVGVVAIYLAKRAREEIQASGEEGSGLATAGLILGWVAVGLMALGVLVLVAYFGFLAVLFTGGAAAS